jgi:hypothetical protein
MVENSHHFHYGNSMIFSLIQSLPHLQRAVEKQPRTGFAYADTNPSPYQRPSDRTVIIIHLFIEEPAVSTLNSIDRRAQDPHRTSVNRSQNPPGPEISVFHTVPAMLRDRVFHRAAFIVY